jgi:hypothetical protein
MAKYLSKELKKRKDLFWLVVSEVSVHHGGEGMAHYDNRKRMPTLAGFLLLPVLHLVSSLLDDATQLQSKCFPLNQASLKIPL